MSENHNYLSLEEVQTIFKYCDRYKSQCSTYPECLVFAVDLATEIRPTALWSLKMGQILEERVHGKDIIVLCSIIGGIYGESKTISVRWRAISDRPVE